MAVFGKRDDATHEEVADYLRIPLGTRFATTSEGKIALTFAGDMSFGESMPEIGELDCGRNLSLDPGVTIRAASVRVKAGLELGAGAKLLTRRLDAGSVVADKAAVEAQEITATSMELKDTQLTANKVTAKESIYADRGELEIGTVQAQTLTLTKGTRSNIQVAAVAKSDGQVSQGGYGSYDEFLAKVFIYHPEILSDGARAEAARILERDKGKLKSVHDLVQPATDAESASASATPAAEAPAETEPQSAPASETQPALFEEQANRLRDFYKDRDTPQEVQELLDHVASGNRNELRRRLNPIYQRLAAQGKIPDPVMETFLELQRLLKEDTGSRQAASPAA